MLRISIPLQQKAFQVSGTCRVAIIGGGFSGASLARQLALHGGLASGDIVVFEPRETLGAGVAYDTADPALRLNVAAHRMRALPEDPVAFIDWLGASGRLATDPDSVRGDAIYARRGDFGAFMQQVMQPLLEEEKVVHVRERVEHVKRHGGLWLVQGQSSTVYLADIVVIATSHPAPRAPAPLALALNGHPRFITDPSRPGALDPIMPDDRVFVAGAGLTALDIVASRIARGHAGATTIFSRSGLLPREQDTASPAPFGDFTTSPAVTARMLLRQVRACLASANEAGLPWQSVFDALRQQGQAIWRNLPLNEQKRFLRHLRRRFETHRYRMPPQNAEVMQRELATGRLRLRAGRICRVERIAHRLQLDLILKPEGIVERCGFDWVIAATGPDHASVLKSQPWLSELERNGFVIADRHGVGIACDEASRAVDRDGQAVDNLFVAGPLARGLFGELTGVPEIAQQTKAIAESIGAQEARSVVGRFLG